MITIIRARLQCHIIFMFLTCYSYIFVLYTKKTLRRQPFHCFRGVLIWLVVNVFIFLIHFNTVTSSVFWRVVEGRSGVDTNQISVCEIPSCVLSWSLLYCPLGYCTFIDDITQNLVQQALRHDQIAQWPQVWACKRACAFNEILDHVPSSWRPSGTCCTSGLSTSYCDTTV